MQVVSVEEGLHLLESPFIDSGYRVEVESVPIGQAYGSNGFSTDELSSF